MTRFYICEHCGNIVGLIHDAGVPLMCCGQKMTYLEPGTADAAKEKHVPAVKVVGNAVKVDIGAVEHPMTAEHSIQWVYLQTDRGGQRKTLLPGEEPKVVFSLRDEKPLAVYAYCNLHGLWKTDITVEEKTQEGNYTVCNCMQVKYWDILDALEDSEKFDDVLKAFEAVKTMTQCSTGCGGCHDKVMDIISEAMMSK